MKINWYKSIINLCASILLFLIWKGCAWCLARWLGDLNQDQWFMAIVAMTVAIRLPTRLNTSKSEVVK